MKFIIADFSVQAKGKFMALFSHRKGIRPLEKALQSESVDEELRNCLWSALTICVWGRYVEPDFGPVPVETREIERLAKALWFLYFKRPLDELPPFNPDLGHSSYADFRKHFFEGEWWEVYDFLEAVIKFIHPEWAASLCDLANKLLEQERSAYRVIRNKIVPISDEIELGAIDDALSSPFAAARAHLQRSLELIGQKPTPDYRNSVKEAISAVESAAKEVTGNSKATLEDCIRHVERRGAFHTAFRAALSKLYAYTSDAGGIRHALIAESVTPTYAEAKFMLVSCSAFVNLERVPIA